MAWAIRLPALRINQGSKDIYLFGVDGKALETFATVSRIRRKDTSLSGYQRPEVVAHVRAIRRYLESSGAFLPNAIVVAFNNKVRFYPSADPGDLDYITLGTLTIPIDPDGPDEDKAAWIVDGQQRAAAIRDADIEAFPIGVVGFMADGQEEQRSQFILANSTKPLPKGIIHELLPEAPGRLPDAYMRRRLPASLITRLNLESGSPFEGLIATPTMKDGYIADNSVMRMLEHSIYDGSLYQYRDPYTGDGEVEQMLLHVKLVWGVVASVWPEAWSLPPTKSRLTHGAGIQAMGYVLDSLTGDTPVARLSRQYLETTIAPLKDVCAWTSGTWRFGDDDIRRWNKVQNTPNDVRVLTRFLLDQVAT